MTNKQGQYIMLAFMFLQLAVMAGIAYAVWIGSIEISNSMDSINSTIKGMFDFPKCELK